MNVAMKKKYNLAIAQAIDGFLTEDEWKYDFDRDRGVFRFGVSIEGRMKQVRYTIGVSSDSFVVYASYPLGGDPEDKDLMARLCEFITRANYGMKWGCFEMDWDDGEIRFKVFVDCEGILPSREIIMNSVVSPGMICNRYADGFIDVIFREADAEKAVAKCEGTMDLLRQLFEDDDEDGDDEAAGESGGDSAEGESPDVAALMADLDELISQALAAGGGPGGDEPDEPDET